MSLHGASPTKGDHVKETMDSTKCTSNLTKQLELCLLRDGAVGNTLMECGSGCLKERSELC